MVMIRVFVLALILCGCASHQGTRREKCPIHDAALRRVTVFSLGPDVHFSSEYMAERYKKAPHAVSLLRTTDRRLSCDILPPERIFYCPACESVFPSLKYHSLFPEPVKKAE